MNWDLAWVSLPVGGVCAAEQPAAAARRVVRRACLPRLTVVHLGEVGEVRKQETHVLLHEWLPA